MTQRILPSGIMVVSDDLYDPTRHVDGVNYTHLTGGIYLPVPMHELNLAQLQDVNRLRDRGFKSGIEQKNDALKGMVADAVSNFTAGRSFGIVDVGSGLTTMAPYFPGASCYVSIDIDPHVVDALRQQGVESHLAKNIRDVNMGGHDVNVLIALYMLQFNVHDDFFEGLASIMREDDVMFANLYRIDDARKCWLRDQAVAAGLMIGPEIADTKISPGRQVFWTMAKDQSAADRLAAMFGAKLSSLPLP
ncbi:hypothetical protein [Micavibrio aeruginosavorus]|uniref:Uncharacterized protein n=1 Tax=Micavibrio aeruginosavorus (strain ARL-13) TaxID=856793 RepID=G2KLY1_MICAA|nr:hypothetical protein [Micavibrio aeruginosavorus]AEP09360.1 hypothetical protein MICA_1030 [Micavibrio aeruginosavorus ARL-13]